MDARCNHEAQRSGLKYNSMLKI